MLLSAIQFFRRKSSAVTLFILVFAGTLIWALRCWLAVLAAGVAPDGTGRPDGAGIYYPALRKREGKASLAKLSYALSAVIAVGMVVTFVQMFQPHPMWLSPAAAAADPGR